MIACQHDEDGWKVRIRGISLKGNKHRSSRRWLKQVGRALDQHMGSPYDLCFETYFYPRRQSVAFLASWGHHPMPTPHDDKFLNPFPY